MTKRVLVGSGAALVALSGFAVTLGIGLAGAEPVTPSPVPPAPPAAGSTDDELADMVLDAIQHGGAAPSTTPAAPKP